MSDTAQVAAPVVADTSNSTPSPETTNENAELDAADAAEEAASTEEAAKPAVKDAKSAKKVEKAIENRIKKLKLKVDGKEIEESLDLDNDEELVRHLQMSKMGQKRAQEKADLEKQVKAFFEAFDKDPFAAMKELGKDPNKAIDDYINQQMEQARKSPEQLAKEQLERELQMLKSEREREKQELQNKELERMQQAAFQQYDIEMEKALTTSDLPKTPYTVKKMADYMLVALQAGYDVKPADVVDIVREEMSNDLKEMFASMPEDKVEMLLGEQMINKLRKRRVAKAAAAQQAVSKPSILDSGKSSKTEAKKEGEKKSFKDFFGI